MEVRAISAGPAMPFADKTAKPSAIETPSAPKPPPQRNAGDETSFLQAIRVEVAPLPFGKSASQPDIDSTAELRAIAPSPALPFSETSPTAPPDVSPASEKPTVTRDPRDETTALPAIINLKPSTPFAKASTAPTEEAPVDPGMLTLEQYASLSAELEALQSPRPDILKRYSLQDESARTKHAIYWARK